MQQSLFMPLLARMPKNRVKTQVVALSPGFTAGAVLRQNGIPVHDIAFSRRRFSFGAGGELLRVTREFRPDVIQGWGHAAQLLALFVRSRCDWPMKVVWSAGDTAPLPPKAGFIDRQKLKLAAKFSKKADKHIYTSEAAAVLHRRAGFPEDGHAVVAPGVDPMRFKPDFAARKKVREQLGIGGDAFVIGMVAPFQTIHDHPTLVRAAGELIKTNPHVSLLLAGHGVQKGNGPLMALVGGGALGTRTHLLGDWSDMSAFFNACDVACSSSLSDSGRLTLVMAMLCGVPCVATGMGAQGEVIGQFGVAVEPGSPTAFTRGITRIMQLPPDRRAFMAQGARKHALNNFVYVRSLQKYLQLYFDMVGRQALADKDVPTPEIDATIPAPPSDMQIVVKDKKAANLVSMQELSDPDSIEEQVKASAVTYKKLKPEEPAPTPVAAPPPREGDVLEIFEADMSQSKGSTQNAMTERARGVADESEELLPAELLHADATTPAAPPKPSAPVVEAKAVEQPAVVAVSKPVEKPVEDTSLEWVDQPLAPIEKSAENAAPVTPEPATAIDQPLEFVVEPLLAAADPIAEAEALERAAAEKLAAAQAAMEQAAKAKQLAEKLAAEKLAAEKAAAEKLAAEKLAAEKLAAEKLAAEKLAAEKQPLETLSTTVPDIKIDAVLSLAAANMAEESPQASLFPELQPAADALQLDLLADPPGEPKLAANDLK